MKQFMQKKVGAQNSSVQISNNAETYKLYANWKPILGLI